VGREGRKEGRKEERKEGRKKVRRTDSFCLIMASTYDIS
jgi:hypothetical protein